MYIILAGAGTIGQEIAKTISISKHSLVVIDKSPEACKKVHTETGALTIEGNATDLSILKKAGADKADIMLCMLRLDSENISCALQGKSLGIQRIIARLHNPYYEDSYKLAGVTEIVRTTDLLINQILMEIEQPKVRSVMNLGKGKAEIFAMRIEKKAKSIGLKIKDITQNKKFPGECVFIGIYREENEEFLIPRGENVIKENDVVFLITKKEFIQTAANLITQEKFSLFK